MFRWKVADALAPAPGVEFIGAVTDAGDQCPMMYANTTNQFRMRHEEVLLLQRTYR